VPPKRAAGQSHNEEAHEEKLKLYDEEANEEKFKKLENREDTKSLSLSNDADEKLKKVGGTRSDKRQENRCDRILSRQTPSQEVEQENQHKDEKDVTPGAVRVQGMDSKGRGDKEDGLTTMPVEDSTIVWNIDLQDKLNAANSTRVILEAQLVEENEREQLEGEIRQKIHDELGQVAQAEIVEDDGSKTRRRVSLCAGIVVILSAIVIGSMLGTGRETRVQVRCQPSSH
jgi:viroplasmin and RNaseH domain-containing protein